MFYLELFVAIVGVALVLAIAIVVTSLIINLLLSQRLSRVSGFHPSLNQRN